MGKYLTFSNNILKTLFKKPATKGYPFVAREFPERTRGSVVIDIDDCIFCGMCMRKCPSSAITVDREKHTWSIDRMGCVQCENCVVNCPKKCLHTDVHYTTPDFSKTVDVFEKIVEAPKAKALPKADLDSCVYCTLCAKNCPNDALTVDRAEKVWKLNEELCVSCGLCAEKCPKKCITMESAEAEAPKADAMPEADLDACVYCTLCAKNCPNDALTVDRAEKVWKLNKELCVSCGLCAEKCPKKCISMK